MDVPIKVAALEIWPKIVYIKGIHKTIADAISWLEYDPNVNQAVNSLTAIRFRREQKTPVP